MSAAPAAPSGDGIAVKTREELFSGPGPESLPQELRDAARADTCCNYCGVSYLIFSEVQSLQRQLAAKTSELETWAERIAKYNDLHREKDEQAARCVELQERNAALSEDISEAVSKHNAAMDKMEAEHSAALKTERERAAADAERRMGALATALEHERAQATSVVTAMLSLSADAIRVKSTIEETKLSLRNDLDLFKQQQLAPLQSAFAQLQNLCRRQNEELSSLKARQSSLQPQLDELTSKLSSAERDLSTARQGRSDAENAIVGLRRELETISGEKARLQTEFREQKNAADASHKAEYGKLASALDSASKQLAEREKELAKEKEGFSSLQQQLKQAQNDVAGLSSRCVQLEDDSRGSLGKLRGEYNQYKTEAEASIASLRSSLDAETKKAKTAQEEAHSLRQRCENAEQRAQLLEQQSQLSSQREAGLQAMLTSSQQMASALQQEVNQLRSFTATTASDSQTMQTQLREAQAVANDASRQRDDIMLEMITMRNENGGLKGEVARLQHETAALRKQLSDGGGGGGGADAAEVASLRTKVDESKEKISQLEALIHQECAERTYLLEEVNALRLNAHMPALTASEVSAAARGFVSPAVQAQAMALLGTVSGGGAGASARGVPPTFPAPSVPAAVMPNAGGGRRSGGGLPSSSDPSPSAGVSLPRINSGSSAGSSAGKLPAVGGAGPASSSSSSLSADDAKWQQMMASRGHPHPHPPAPSAAAQQQQQQQQQQQLYGAGVANAELFGLNGGISGGGAGAPPRRQGMSARMSGSGGFGGGRR